MSRRITLALLAAVSVLQPIVNSAVAQSPSQPTRWFDAISVDCFISTAYTYNFNRPDTLKNSYRVFDFDDNSMKIDVAELSVKKDVLNSGDAGFRVDATVGSSIPRIARSSGLNTGDLDFHQVVLSYLVSDASGLRLDFGKFITSMGYEVIEGYDGYNDNYSRSLLFGYAIPFTHTGLKASYIFSPKVNAMLMVVNGWDNAIDNNASKSVCAQIGIVPIGGMNVAANFMFGPEKSNNVSDNRRILDVTGSYAPNTSVTVGVNGDWAAEDHSANNGGTAVWRGLALYLRMNLLREFSMIARAEQFEDADGVRTGISQKLREITFTPEFRPAEHLVVRADFRVDASDQNVFQSASRWKDIQATAGLNILFAF